MKAIIDATGHKLSLAPLLNYRPSPLLNVCDKPILFHIIDLLIPLKIDHYELLLSHLPAEIEDVIGNGNRWGISISYQLVRDPALTFARMRTLARHWGASNVFIASGDGIPKLQNIPLETSLLWMYPHHRWSGWGILPATLIASLNTATTPKLLPECMPPEIKSVYTSPSISTDSLYDFKKSNFNLLQEHHSNLHFPANARQLAEGVWISHGASIHPSSKIIPPVFIGENTQIKEQCEIGPQVVIESNCLIDKDSQLSQAVILRHSYIGEGLQVKNSIVDRNLLINLTFKTSVLIRDDFILCEMTPPSLMHNIFYMFERFIALILILLLLPFYMIMFYNHHLCRQQMLKLPAKNDPSQWKEFSLYSFEARSDRRSYSWQRNFKKLPTLFNIFLGNLHFVGVSPRSIEAVELLPIDWQGLYLKTKNGLITLSKVNCGENPTDDEAYASEAYYAATMGFRTELALFWRWFKMKLTRRDFDAKS